MIINTLSKWLSSIYNYFIFNIGTPNPNTLLQKISGADLEFLEKSFAVFKLSLIDKNTLLQNLLLNSHFTEGFKIACKSELLTHSDLLNFISHVDLKAITTIFPLLVEVGIDTEKFLQELVSSPAKSIEGFAEISKFACCNGLSINYLIPSISLRFLKEIAPFFKENWSSVDHAAFFNQLLSLSPYNSEEAFNIVRNHSIPLDDMFPLFATADMPGLQKMMPLLKNRWHSINLEQFFDQLQKNPNFSQAILLAYTNGLPQ
jgi:hypothetical protein